MILKDKEGNLKIVSDTAQNMNEYDMGEHSMNIFEEQKKYEEAIKIINQDLCKDILWHMTADILQKKNSAMAMEFTRVICDLLRANGVYVHCTETKFSEKITENSIEEKYGILFDSMDFSEHDKVFADEIDKLKQELHRKETIINQIDDILNELFGVTHDITNKPDEFQKILKEKIENSKTIVDFLPTEPIQVADMLINTKGEYERNAVAKAFYGTDKGTYNLFDISELRQIAEHLLIYCNANGEGE